MKKKLFLSLLVTSLSLSALTVSAAESSSEPDSLTFEALSRYTFEFSSGAAGSVMLSPASYHSARWMKSSRLRFPEDLPGNDSIAADV